MDKHATVFVLLLPITIVFGDPRRRRRFFFLLPLFTATKAVFIVRSVRLPVN